jgi:hypothetical protein
VPAPAAKGRKVTGADPQELKLLARLVLWLIAVLVVAGAIVHGITSDEFERMWYNLIDRPSGPMAFRFYLQPSIASLFAIVHGVRDARGSRSPFLWTILWNSEERGGRLREGWNATARIILVGIAVDTAYQLMVLNWFHPSEAVVVALLLAFLPYIIVRGFATRVARKWAGGAAAN